MQLRQGLVQQQTLQMKQLLSPQMIQMLRTFHYSYDDLLKQVKIASRDNVFIEVTQFDSLMDYGASKNNTSNTPSYLGKDISDFAADIPSKQNLYSFLLSQLELLGLSQNDFSICSYMIDFIDNRGYMADYPSAKDTLIKRFGISDRKVFDMLKIIQSLEPDGVGARDLKECLLIQVKNHEFKDARLEEVLTKTIQHHLEDLAEQRFDVLTKSIQLDIDGIKALADFIKHNLNPNPGFEYSATPLNNHVIPSFEATWENDTVHLKNLEASLGISITISEKYLKMLNDPKLDAESKTYLKEKLTAAQTLKDNIQKRRESMERMAWYIVTKQSLFIRSGKLYLAPLTQKQISEELSITPSTVSRILSSKYIRTPFGVFALKQLCPRNHFGRTAEQLQAIIKDICEANPGLSDQKLTKGLHDMGIPLARRTITKYRLSTGVKSSYIRKRD